MKNVKTKALLCIAVLFALGCLMSPHVAAQTANTGVATGVVKDEGGAVVPNAAVKIINTGTNAERTATTGDEGTFEVPQLVPGNYRVEIEAQGFARYIQEPVVINTLSRTTIDAELRPAGAAEQVTVSGAEAPLVETTKTDVGGVIDQRRLENLPVNGRSFASLAILIPGATLQPSFDPTKARVGTFSVGGSTGRNVNVTIDGGDNKDNAVGGILQNFSLEGIQEFALSTQRFSAANGRSGGALLSVVSKSGTNRISGSVFGFFRDDKLNANAPKLLAEANENLFDAGDAVKPPFDRQQFGGSIGGPILRDKLFFFGALERTRERGNSIVPSRIFNEIGLIESFGYTPVRFLSQPFNDTEYTAKVDYNASSKNTFVFRFAGQNNDALNDQAGFLTVFTDESGGNQTLNALYNGLTTWTHIVNQNTVNQFTAQYSHFDNRINATTDLLNFTFPSLDVGRNGNVPQQTIQKKLQFRDDLSYTRGQHSFKFGVDFTYVPKLGGLFAFTSAPNYSFIADPSVILGNPDQFPQGFRTSQVGAGAITCAYLGLEDADCNTENVEGLGVVDGIFLAGGDPSFTLRKDPKQFAFYVQDDWKATSRLTLNLGVRYDVDLGFVDEANQEKNRTFRLLQIIGHPFGERIARDDINNFSPRLGFAYDVTGNARSVIRGGYGIYFDQSFLNVPLFAVQQANPEIYGTVFNDGANLSLDTPPPSFPRPLTNPAIGFPLRGRLIDPNFEAPYTQQFNIGFAQELDGNSALEVDFVHILGLHEFTQIDANPRTGPLRGLQRGDSNPPRLLTPLYTQFRDQIIAEFGQATPFASIRVAQSDGRSRYDALTVSFRRRYANKYQLNAHYTLSRALAWFGQISDFGVQPQNPFNKFDPTSDFGYSGEDERHRFVVSGVFDLPYGFQIAPVFQVSSARPYSIFPEGGADINRDGVFNDRETRDDNDQNKLPPSTERGDKFSQLNVRVSKFFNFSEQRRLGVFFEAFNVFNTANFGNSFDGSVGSPDFKRPVNFFGANGFSEPIGIPFQAQLGARFSF